MWTWSSTMSNFHIWSWSPLNSDTCQCCTVLVQEHLITDFWTCAKDQILTVMHLSESGHPVWCTCLWNWLWVASVSINTWVNEPGTKPSAWLPVVLSIASFKPLSWGTGALLCTLMTTRKDKKNSKKKKANKWRYIIRRNSKCPSCSKNCKGYRMTTQTVKLAKNTQSISHFRWR